MYEHVVTFKGSKSRSIPEVQKINYGKSLLRILPIRRNVFSLNQKVNSNAVINELGQKTNVNKYDCCAQLSIMGEREWERNGDVNGVRYKATLLTEKDEGGFYCAKGKLWRYVSPTSYVPTDIGFNLKLEMVDEGNVVRIMEIQTSQNLPGLGAIGLYTASNYGIDKDQTHVVLQATGEQLNGGFYERYGFTKTPAESRMAINNMRERVGLMPVAEDSANLNGNDETLALNHCIGLAGGNMPLIESLRRVRYSGPYTANVQALHTTTLRPQHN